jgi:folate-binding protein YgfZ
MQTEINKRVENLYRAAHDQYLIVAHEAPGVVMLTGEDRLDLLNRMSTNDLRDLPPGHWKRTILTNALARIVDVVMVFSQESDVLLLTSPGRAENILAWLSGYIFFQDNVQVSMPELDLSLWGIYGPAAGIRLGELGISHVPVAGGEFAASENGLVWHVARPAPGGLQLLLSDDARSRSAALRDAANLPEAREAYEILRIESGLPRMGYEITDETIPLEVGLWDDVSFSKGCYIGQEILVRMEGRGQIARRLVLVQLSHPLPHGSSLLSEGRKAGRLTSVANSPELGWIGLALVRTNALERGTLQTQNKAVEIRILDPLQRNRTSRTSPA